MSLQKPFTQERRQEILQEYFQLQKRSRNFQFSSVRSLKGVTQERLDQERMYQLCQEYRAEVPIIPLCRCPFCNTVIYHSLDTFGLDGLWWNYETPIRPEDSPIRSEAYRQGLCQHYLALSGAVRLSQPIENAPIKVQPGPEVPFVVKRLMRNQSVWVVISSIGIGAHTGYPIFYFSDLKPLGVKLVNTWGTDYYVWEKADGTEALDQVDDFGQDDDFELAPWISQGRVLWIAPEDASLRLRIDVADCPYLNLPGRRDRFYVQDGKVWEGASLPADLPEDFFEDLYIQ
jgi:hypothetical protein